MLRHAPLCGIAIFAPLTAASAQTTDVDYRALVAAAEEAAAQAENAVTEAQKALGNAQEAAKAARAAADAARQIANMPARVGRPRIATTTSEALPADENVPVEGPVQAASAETIGQGEREIFRNALANSVANGPNDSPLKSTPIPSFELLASSKDKVGSLAFTLDISGRPAVDRLVADQLSITASSKLDDSGEANIIGLDGLNAGSEIKLTYTHFSSRMQLSGREKDPVRIARQNCLVKPHSKVEDCDPYAFKTGVSDFVSTHYKEGVGALFDEVLPGPVWFYGASVGGTQASYKFLDRTAFKMDKANRLGWSGGLFGGVLLGHGETSIIGSYDYRRTFKEQDSVNLCQDISGTTLTQCFTAADGAPTKSKKSIFGLEFRNAFPLGEGPIKSIAIAPKFNIDVENDAYSFALPLYFGADDTGRLRAGIRAVYLNEKAKNGSREDDFTVGLFVGVPFTAFKQ